MYLRSGRLAILRFVVALLITLFSVIAFAQQARVLAPHAPIAPRVPKNQELPLPPAKLGSIVSGPWITDANFKSALYLKNVVENHAVTVTPILYLANGMQYSLPQVSIDPAGTATVDINAALNSLGIASYATLSGYVEVRYNWPWLPLCGFIRNVDTAHSMIFVQGVQPLPEEILTPAKIAQTKPQVLEGMWWKQESNVTGFVTLSNTAQQPVAAVLDTSDSRGIGFATHSVTISPHGTKIINLTELLGATQTEGGLRVTYTGAQEALIGQRRFGGRNCRLLSQYPLYRRRPCSKSQQRERDPARIDDRSG